MKKILFIILIIFTIELYAQTDIYNVQQNESLVGQSVTVIGIVTVTTGIFLPEITHIADAGGGPWSGIVIRDNTAEFFGEQGKKVRLSGTVSENNGLTEILLDDYIFFSNYFTLPPAEQVNTNDIATGSSNAESYESVLVQVDSVSVVNDNLGNGEWLVDDGSGSCRIDDDADYLFYEVPSIGTNISSIAGILNYTNNNYKLEPRFQSDIVDNDTSSITNIYNIQQDKSMIGDSVTVTGIVTAATGIFTDELTFIEDPYGGPWSGILLRDSTSTFIAAHGDEVCVFGEVVENEGVTEITVDYFEILSTGNPFPELKVIPTNHISSNNPKAEIYEGVLCQITDVYISNSDAGNGEWEVDDGSGECRIGNSSDSLIYEVSSVGSPVTSITGIVNYSADYYKLEPRYHQDICEFSSIPIGDTITVIQRPILNIPTILRVGDTLSVKCEADPSTSSWAAEIFRDQYHIPLEIVNANYNVSTLWWTISALIPDVPLLELYNLKVTVNNEIADTTKNAVKVISEFKDDYYFIHITDPHLPTHKYLRDGATINDSSEMVDLREVIKDINIIDPEFVLLTGDLVNEGELEEHQNFRSFTRAQRILTELKVPFYLTSGNHDLGGWSSTPPPDGTARRTWWQFFGWKRLNDPPPGAPWYTQNYSFDYGPVHYTGLEVYDNYDWWREGIYGPTSFTDGQIEWLNNDLASASESISDVIFHHYDYQEQLNLDALGIDMALYGHIHSDNGDPNAGPPYNLATNNVCNGERSYRLIRVSNGILTPSETISAGWEGENLSVEFLPANDGTNNSVTAQIINSFNEQFEHAQLGFIMPLTDDDYKVSGGTLIQTINTDTSSICYVNVDIQPASSQTVTVSLFSGPFAQNCTVNKSYLSPGTDTLTIITEVINPDNQDLQVKSILESYDQSVLDSIVMFDDGNHNDGAADDGFYGASRAVTLDENFYNIHIAISTSDSSYYDVTSGAACFTTVGPIKYENLIIVQQIGSTHRTRLILRNEGSFAAASNINAELIIDDADISIEDNYRYFSNIDPGETAQSNTFYNIIAENPPNSVDVQMQIFSNDKFFWEDSFKLIFVEDELAGSESNIPQEFALGQNFPNPFNPSTTFKYDIPVETNVVFTLYDINGRIIETLVNEKQNPGYYSIYWNASDVSSGIYFFRIQAGDYIDMKKFAVIK